VAWDRWLSREYGRSVRKETAEAVRDRGVQSATLTGRLRGHAEQVETSATELTRERPAAPTLSEDDARRIVREQAERRQRERQERVAARAREQAERAGASDVGGSPPAPAAEPETPAEGLFAAKARARKRMDGQDEESR